MCSTIIFGDTNKSLAANYDYAQDHGLIATNLRGTKKSNGAPSPDKRVEWTVSYGSVTFNQFSLEFPVSGMNEAGLAIALMWHDKGDFGDDEEYTRLNELQWIQYQLDNHANIAEVVNALHTIRPERGPLPLHFTALDATGDHALIEFIDGELVLHQNQGFPILTNSSYNICLAAAQAKTDIDINTSGSSTGRFKRLYQMLHKNTVASNGFEFLDAVNSEAMDDRGFPWNQGQQGTVTAWSTVFDPVAKTVQVTSSQNRTIRQLSLERIDFSADATYQITDVHAGGEGDLASLLEPYAMNQNQRILQLSAKQLGLPEGVAVELATVVDGLYQRRQM